jgi:hypothetical protein
VTRVILWSASYGCPATVVLEVDGVPEEVTDFDGGGNTYWANRHAKDHAHELASQHAVAITPAKDEVAA